MAPVAVGAHEALTTDSIPLVLAPARFTRSLGAGLVTADVFLPAIPALLDIAHDMVVPGVAADPREGGGGLNTEAGNQAQQGSSKHEGGGGGEETPRPPPGPSRSRCRCCCHHLPAESLGRLLRSGSEPGLCCLSWRRLFVSVGCTGVGLCRSRSG